VHEVEQPWGVVLHLDVDVELYVAVLGLNNRRVLMLAAQG
jgi:hypothetical protein